MLNPTFYGSTNYKIYTVYYRSIQKRKILSIWNREYLARGEGTSNLKLVKISQLLLTQTRQSHTLQDLVDQNLTILYLTQLQPLHHSDF